MELNNRKEYISFGVQFDNVVSLTDCASCDLVLQLCWTMHVPRLAVLASLDVLFYIYLSVQTYSKPSKCSLDKFPSIG